MPVFRKDGKNILFVHVPKTGGSSIDTVFRAGGYEMHFVDGQVGQGTINHLRRCTPQHMHGAMLRQTFKLNRFDLIFMIVRDPIARFRSEYLWRNRTKKHIPVHAAAVQQWAQKSFAKFDTDSYTYDNHLRPQADFLVPGARVYRFEDGMDSIVADLIASHGLDLTPEVPRLREGTTNTGVSSRDVMLSPETEKRIKQFYRRDYEEFGYPDGPRMPSLASARRSLSRSPVAAPARRLLAALRNRGGATGGR